MKSLLTYFTLAVFVLSISSNTLWNTAFDDFYSQNQTLPPCPNPCQVSDSLVLIDIYNATQGPFWLSPWVTSQPVCTWPGVELDSEGYVIRLTLNNNNLNGPLPLEIGNLTRIAELQLDNNNLSGTIPTEIGNLSNLAILFLDDNNFVGTIPEDFGNLSFLNTLYLDNNQLTGAVPNTFLNLTNLFKFDIFNNMIDSIPDLSSINLQPNRFRTYNNHLTFDDLLSQNLLTLGNHYHPQDSVNAASTVNLQTGTTYILDLDFDNEIIDNSYQWYKNGVPFGAPTNSNKLTFSPVDWSDAGEYRCQVSNTNLPLLTLHTRPVTINVSCGTSVFEVTDTLCQGESMTVNGVLYNESNPGGTQMLPEPDQYGCDSVIVVDLTFNGDQIVEIEETICIGDSFEIDGLFFDYLNPSDTFVLSTPDQYGCDSIVSVNLTFFTGPASGNLNPIICESDSIEILGVFYSQSNPNGTVVLENAAATGCDSTLYIEVQFYAPAIGNYNPNICNGSSILYEGVEFDQDMPSGQINLGPVSQNGCDSLVNVDVSFYGPSEGTFEETLCYGESVTIQGTVYDQSNPTGTEFFPGGGSVCDSVVFVNLSFENNIVTTVNPTLCPGESIIVNGVIFDEANPNGSEMIPGGSVSGCDSTVMVNLSFYTPIESIYDPVLCPGESVIVQGNTYDASNPNGTEIFSNSINGCDSTVTIALSFYPESTMTIEDTLCNTESILVNGIVYNESNPSGTEILTGANSNGCDSTVIVDLSFNNEILTTFDPTVCPESSFNINNNIYDFNNPSGTETMVSANGCDSTVSINLNFYPDNAGFVNSTLCSGEEMIINGTVYNEGNPSGTELIENGSVNGCDSTVNISLSFMPISQQLLNPVLCFGESVLVNGNTYDENNPSGTEIFENAASNGCDSVVTIDLSFYTNNTFNLSETLCPSESLLVNGVTYDENNPSGVEVLANAGVNGCDSTINISLDFYSIPQTIINNTLCEQDEIMVNNQIYNFSNPSGTEVISNGSANGCDSIVIIDLDFHPVAEFNLNSTLCPNDSIEVNNVIYDQNNPTGTEIIENASVNNCDSVVHISLSFYAESVETLNPVICEEEELLVNNVIYNFSNPTGTEIIENASVNGCDSIVNINLSFYPSPQGMLNPIICNGEVFEFNGSVFDENNTTGTETLENAGVNGCDSTVFVQLDFYSPATGNFTSTICPDESVIINGTLYDFNHSNGTEVLEKASANGCDSTILVNISFFDPVITSTNVEICEGTTFEIGNQSFSSSGNYEIVLDNASSNGCDSTILLNLDVLDAEDLGEAEAGDDFANCQNKITLSGNLPSGSNGVWKNMDGIPINDHQNPVIEIDNLPAGYQTFVWTLSSNLCSDYDADTVQVYIESAPVAFDDIFAMDGKMTDIDLYFTDNDDFSSNEYWFFEFLSEPSTGVLSELGEGEYNFERTDPLASVVTFEYQICNEDCPDLCDTASVRINIEELAVEIPNAITPNGDGVNETFMFPQLEYDPERFPDRELIIFNRWGDIIFEAQPYHNDWNGVDRSGKDLPQGTYYFVLRLDNANGQVIKGDITILK